MKTLFLASTATNVLDDIVKHLPKNPKDYNLAFITTASEIYTGDLWWVRNDKEKLIKTGFNLTEFSITGLTKNEIEEKLKNIDIIFVCGGNVFYLLDQVIKTNFNEILIEKSKKNLIYIGSSAGSMILGKRIELVSTLDDRSKAPNLKSDGLSFIDLAILPHWGNPKFKEEYLQASETTYEANTKIILLNDQQYLLVQDEDYKIVQV